MKENWKQELSRDTLAIGGLAFYVMFIARAFIAPYYTYAIQLVSSLVIFYILTIFIKNSEQHLARAFIAAFFTALFYNVQTFTIFTVIIYLAIFGSAIYLKKTKTQISKGLILGIISAIIGYYLTTLF